MKKVMIVQPMAGRTDEEILETRNNAIRILEEDGYEILETLFDVSDSSRKGLTENGIIKASVYYLGRSLQAMSEADAVYFCSGWGSARGCQIEHRVAREYGIPALYEGVRHNGQTNT